MRTNDCRCRIELQIGPVPGVDLNPGIPYVGGEKHQTYSGPYTVIPVLHDDQVLETREKLMTDDMTVKAIPIVQTTNPYGGQTIVIG